MRKKIICFFVFFAMLCNIGTAFAIDIKNDDFDIIVNDVGKVEIKGDFSAEKSSAFGRQSDMMITMSLKEAGAEDYLFFNQYTLNSQWKLDENLFQIWKPTDYVFFFTDSGGNKVSITENINIDICKVFNYLKNSANTQGLQELFEARGDEIDFDFIAYESLTDAQKTAVISNALGLSDVSSIDELKQAVKNIGLFNLMLANATGTEPIIEYIGKSVVKENGVFNTPSGKLFTEQLTAEQKNSIVSGYVGNSSFAMSGFNEATVKMYINSAICDYTQMSYLFEEYKGAAEFSESDMSEYENIKDKAVVWKKMYQLIPISNLTDFYASFGTYVTEQKNTENQSAQIQVNQTPVITSNGGGGGGGGMSISGSIPQINAPSTANTAVIAKPSVVDNKKVFTDIDNVGWAKSAIDALAEQGIINGVSEDSFQPDENVTREQFIKMLTLGLRMTGVESEVECFEDVNKEDWYYTAISAAFRADIISGISETEFGVGRPVSRQDMAVMLLRAAKAKKISLESESEKVFSDSDDISEYAKESVLKLAGTNLINGMEDGSFKPKEYLTRAQAAKVLYDFLKYAQMIK